MTHIVGVLLAGGKGTRLWPLSTPEYPKQFITVSGMSSCLFLQTVDRILPVCNSLIVVTTSAYHSTIATLLADYSLPYVIMVEPEGRNSAAPLMLASCYAKQYLDDDTVLWCMPTDHIITDAAGLCSAARHLTSSLDDSIGMFGITPDSPNSHYGHIACGTQVSSRLFRVQRFVEKPSFEAIGRLTAHAEVVWNSGMFIFSSSAFIPLMERYQPLITSCVNDAFAEHSLLDSTCLLPSLSSYCNSPAISVDYALLEHCASKLLVYPLDVGWTDVGSWKGLWQASAKDSSGTVYYPLREVGVDFYPVVQDDVAAWVDKNHARLVLQPKTVYEEQLCLV